jgi:hypothetical protein
MNLSSRWIPNTNRLIQLHLPVPISKLLLGIDQQTVSESSASFLSYKNQKTQPVNTARPTMFPIVAGISFL